MRLRSVVVMFGLGMVLPSLAVGATQEQACRKSINKQVAKLYQQGVTGPQACFKTRIAVGGAADCLGDPAAYDPSDKLTTLTDKLAGTLGPLGTCAALGPMFAPSCAGAPAACAGVCAVCGTGAQVAQCLGCRVVALAQTQVHALYGTPPNLSSDGDAQGCQNALGKETLKYGRARMKEQQGCQRDVDGDTLRIHCDEVDLDHKIAAAATKATPKLLAKCLTSPGSDQIPSLDTATGECLTGGTAAGAAACALTATNTAVDGVFGLISRPAVVHGFVSATTPGGDLAPLPGVRIEVVGASIGQFTDRNGAYRLENVPPGQQLVAIDGQRVGNYPRIAMGTPVGMVGAVNMGIFVMPEIDMANAVDIGGVSTVNPDGSRTLTAPVVLSNPTIPGASLDLPMGTTLTFDQADRAPLLTLSMVPQNVMAFPAGVFSDQIYSFQPEGTILVPPAAAIFPNNTGLPDGSSADIYVPDFAINAFYLAGMGTVTTLGTQVESNGPVISAFDWHFVSGPPGCMTTVIGRVVTSGLVPVANATVLAIGATTTSIGDGTFQLANLPCPPTTIASAQAVDAAGILGAGQSAPTPTVPAGITNVGDIVLTFPTCGNTVTTFPEQCDDGGNQPADGCSPTCRLEICGNAIVDPGEQCDGTPMCTRFCTVCGDYVVRTPGEECDHGVQNGTPGDSCSANCLITICGNGVVEDGEECDLGTANGGSVCDDDCRLKSVNAAIGGSLVRATLECTTPNTATFGGAPACTPPPLDSGFRFGPAGKGSFEMAFIGNETDAIVKTKLSDVRDAGDVLVTSAGGWTMRVTLRITLQGATGSSPDATLIDRTMAVPMRLDALGVLAAGATVSSALGVNLAAYTRHAIELVDFAIVDQVGGVFAAPGYLIKLTPELVLDAPASASGGFATLVQGFVGCGLLGGNTPSTTVSGIPACAPPETFNEQAGSPAGGWLYGPNCKPVTTYTVTTAGDVTFTVEATDIRKLSGVVDGSSGSVAHVLRNTQREPGAEMTVIDFPLPFGVTVSNGKINRVTSVNTILGGISQPPLPSTEGMPVGVGTGGGGYLSQSPVLRDSNNNDFGHVGLRDAQ